MTTWREEIEQALEAFFEVARLAGEPLRKEEIRVEFLDAPHRPPTKLPAGIMAVYGFWWNGTWLKIGKAGPKTAARYTYQHYNPNSTNSNLAKSLLSDSKVSRLKDFDIEQPGEWMKVNTCRVNILLPARLGSHILSLLEAFLHVRLNPRYEGR